MFKGKRFSDIAVGVIIVVLGAAAAKLADIPTRVAVLEANQTSTISLLQSMDKKLDIALRRVQ